MGITPPAAARLCDEVRAGAVNPHDVLTIGQLDLVLTLDEANALLLARGFSAVSEPSAEQFFRALGARNVSSVDISDFEGASILQDMNKPIDDCHRGRFTLVYDGGTMEHVFNVPQFLINVHEFLSFGGVAVHENPMHGWIDHGFYQFSPTFYSDYYSCNNYKIIHQGFTVHRLAATPHQGYSDYEPGMFDGKFLKLPPDTACMNRVCARKTEKSTAGVTPMQGFYVRRWPKQ